MKPSVEVLGVYRLTVTSELVSEQTDILYGADMEPGSRILAEAQIRTQLESVALVEVMIHDVDARFDSDDFTQKQDGVAAANWQVAWCPSFLTADGERSLGEQRPVGESELRMAFFLHLWSASTPLTSSYGETTCPEPKAMPERLARIAPYELLG